MENNNEKEIVFDKYWFIKHQSKILWLANSFFGKYVFGFKKMGHYLDYKIIKMTPVSVAERLPNNQIREHFFSRNEYARKLYLVLLPLWYAMHIWDWFVADHFQLAPQLSFGFSTLTVYCGAVSGGDGYCYTGGYLSFATYRSAATGTYVFVAQDGLNAPQCNIVASAYEIGRAFFPFYTAALTSNATVSAAIFSYYVRYSVNLDGQLIGLVQTTQADPTTLTTADYNKCGSVDSPAEGATRVDSSAISGAYLDITLNATGLTLVSKTAYTQLGLRLSKDIDNSAPTVNEYAYVPGSGSANANKPKLVITYTYSTPTVTTQAVSSIADTTATGNGNVTSDGGATVTERGVCWKTSTGPTTADSKATASGTTGAYTASMTGLTASTLYYVKAYAINSVGTSYGSEVTFTSSAPVTAIKAILGIAIADVKTINGIAGASIKSIMGLTYVQPPLWYGERGIFISGYSTSAYDNTIDYITIATTGNATDFGDAINASRYSAGSSNSTRVITAARWDGALYNSIYYITIATLGNSVSFGQLSLGRYTLGGSSNGVRGIFHGGYISEGYNTIDYITISTTGNATDFGDLSSICWTCSGVSDNTKSILALSYTGAGYANTLEYITITTTGNASDFGDLTTARSSTGCSSLTRGVFSGGYETSVDVNTIDYITIATTGNATDFGDLTVARRYMSSCGNGIRVTISGGVAPFNTIDYITIATTGNATDFGDLTVARDGLVACSGN